VGLCARVCVRWDGALNELRGAGEFWVCAHTRFCLLGELQSQMWQISGKDSVAAARGITRSWRSFSIEGTRDTHTHTHTVTARTKCLAAVWFHQQTWSQGRHVRVGKLGNWILPWVTSRKSKKENSSSYFLPFFIKLPTFLDCVWDPLNVKCSYVFKGPWNITSASHVFVPCTQKNDSSPS